MHEIYPLYELDFNKKGHDPLADGYLQNVL